MAVDPWKPKGELNLKLRARACDAKRGRSLASLTATRHPGVISVLSEPPEHRVN
jgi:hypothetical protein